MRRGIPWTACAALAVWAILALPPATAPARGGLSGKYSGKITRAGPMKGKITLRVRGHRARLVKIPLVIGCRSQTGERVDKVVRGSRPAPIKQGYSHPFFNIRRV